jgi:hypothetical protein
MAVSRIGRIGALAGSTETGSFLKISAIFTMRFYPHRLLIA